MGLRGNWDRRISRRAFIGMGGMGAAALASGAGGASAAEAGYGPLQPDPGGIVELPKGFQYRIISPEGTKLSNGAPVPSDFDGMAAFRGPKKGTTLLVRNHELSASDDEAVQGTNPYDGSAIGPGGTTGIVVDNRSRKALKDFVTSSGQSTNCAGGATPWGTWLTCEETKEAGTEVHGYVFEVNPRNPQSDLSKTPITAMGRFSHEAVDIDSETGIVYLTEDDPSGNSNTQDPTADTGASFLYRFIPNNRSKRPGALLEGGKLQVMAIDKVPATYDADLFERGQRFKVVWKTILDPNAAHEQALAVPNAIKFNRLEGAFFKGGAFWFDDTNGGEKRLGQIFRYFPSTNTLELFYEGNDPNEIESPDNITITPFGDLWFAEDEIPTIGGNSRNRVMGVTPGGRIYKFARNVLTDSEFAGPTFSPDGRTFFVNIQNPGLTLAIWGPFRYQNPSRQARMSVAAPPKELAPAVSGELAEAAERYGMGTLEAAALDRLGVALA